MFARALLLIFPVLVSASPALRKQPSVVTSDPSSADGQTFDYIIVGGGLGGLTVAGRLTEDSSKTVLVVEAGNDDRTNPNISDIFNYGAVFQTDLDWHWETDMGRVMRGGRTLGGSTSINSAHWTRGMKAYYDSLSQLLTEEDAALNWTFDSLFSYMKKAETFHPPDEAQRAKGANFVPEYHGFSGPVQSTFTPFMFGGPQQPAFISGVRNVTGIEQCPDITGGFANCVAYTAHTMNPSANFNRSSSATAYISPVEFERTNWVTLVGHQVTKVLLDGEAPNVTATGVQFKKSDNTGDDFTANARLEVIVSSGAIGTPQVLQVSGIGDPEVLEPLGIPVKVNLRTVGRNFQEKVLDLVVHSLQPSFNSDGRGPPDCIAFPSLRQIFAESAGSNGSVTFDEIADYITAMIPSWAESQAVNGLNAEALTTIFGVQAGLIIDDNVPAAELLFNTTAPSGLYTLTWIQHPFSRGNVTIVSPSIFTPPQVNINWFSVDFDLALQTAIVRTARKVLNDPAFDGISAGEVSPGIDTVPDDGHGGSDAAWQAWIREDFTPVFHPIGSASMMRRDLGGVVDGKLRVYDTVNVRVVDASTLPIELAAHLSSTLYGVAEKAADIIKSGI